MIPINDNLTSVNRTLNGDTSRIKYIVVHYTSNKNDTAYNNTQYFKSVNRGASAHYFVDDSEIWRCVSDGDIAWHCGAKIYKHTECRNANSIGVEMCTSYSGGRYFISEKTAENTAELVRALMDQYGVPAEKVLRHYDVTGKNCPAPWVTAPEEWDKFKKRLEEGEDMARLEELQTQLDELKAVINTMGGKIHTLQNPMIYNYMDDNMPDWAKPEVQRLMDAGILRGTGAGLNLNDDRLWMCVILGRMMKQLESRG